MTMSDAYQTATATANTRHNSFNDSFDWSDDDTAAAANMVVTYSAIEALRNAWEARRPG
jgi:TnpA family transposase